ncbi:hypothetical protein CWE09_04855 [Aliidiomarina minuta]|uniref:PA2779 family protein n=2 Tax=Aliidiomarina minuta TaxID=880057 RepID=A0A432W7J9_9GAMM|nr:hypothetical protein CWE09_04855 [Aliidiomarina minuta]
MNKIQVIGTTFLAGSLLLSPAVSFNAHADIVSTEQVVSEQQSGLDRIQLTEQLERTDIQSELIRYGVDPDEAIARVHAMTDEEVMALTAGIDELPAGAGISISVILLGIIIYLLVR